MAVQIRDIVEQVYVIAHGEKVENPAESVRASSIEPSCPRIESCLRWRSGW